MSIYFSNNYSKLISKKILDEIDKWNQVIENNKNLDIDNIISKYKSYIYNLLNLSTNKYEIFITNGIRSYNLIFKLLHTMITSGAGSKSTIHIIISNTNDSNVLTQCRQLLNNKILDVTFINPNKYGIIELETIKKILKKILN